MGGGKWIDQEGLKKALALCRGQMSAVLASRLDPGTITVLKGNKPLCLRIHYQHRVVLYASVAHRPAGGLPAWRA